MSEYRKQMHHDVIMPEDLVQEESVIEPEVGNISFPEPPKNHKKKNEGFEILKSHHVLKQKLL